MYPDSHLCLFLQGGSSHGYRAGNTTADAAGFVLVVPVISRQRGVMHPVTIAPPEGGVKQPSDILCDGLRSMSKARPGRRLGEVSSAPMQAAEQRLRILMGL